MTHKERLEEIEQYLLGRKREETDYLRHLIQKEEQANLDEEGKAEMRATESKILSLLVSLYVSFNISFARLI
jgi:hypothetical protein